MRKRESFARAQNFVRPHVAGFYFKAQRDKSEESEQTEQTVKKDTPSFKSRPLSESDARQMAGDDRQAQNDIANRLRITYQIEEVKGPVQKSFSFSDQGKCIDRRAPVIIDSAI